MALGDYMGASCHACIGGTNVRAEVQKLQMEAPHIIVGTPGRVFDMLNRRYLCEYRNTLVLGHFPLLCIFLVSPLGHNFANKACFPLKELLYDEPHACHLSLASLSQPR